jgi:uncharacterized membrane protein
LVPDLLDILAALDAWVIPLLELIALAIILGGGFWTITTLIRSRDTAKARQQFSHSLLLGLDFTIGSDVLRLAIAPNLTAAATAAVVTGVRIALTFTLLKEQSTDSSLSLKPP